MKITTIEYSGFIEEIETNIRIYIKKCCPELTEEISSGFMIPDQIRDIKFKGIMNIHSAMEVEDMWVKNNLTITTNRSDEEKQTIP